MTKGNANKLAKEQFAHIYARYAGVDYSAEITANYIALWHSDFDESMEDKEWYIMPKEYEEVAIDESLADKFSEYVERVKDKVYAFNQAIQEDLLNPAGSRLETFIA